MMAMWRGLLAWRTPYLRGVLCASQRRASGLRQHGVDWILVWRLGVGLGIPRLRQCSCKGIGPTRARGLGGAMESTWTYNGGVLTHFV
jgi:hypothetical protein